MGTSTPWGVAQGRKKYGSGITFYYTAGHGGFKVSPTRLEAMHPALRIDDGWYEEDVDAALVIFAFRHLFQQGEVEGAIRTIKNYYPEKWEAVTNIPVKPEESIKLREAKVIAEANMDRFDRMRAYLHINDVYGGKELVTGNSIVIASAPTGTDSTLELEVDGRAVATMVTLEKSGLKFWGEAPGETPKGLKLWKPTAVGVERYGLEANDTYRSIEIVPRGDDEFLHGILEEAVRRGNGIQGVDKILHWTSGHVSAAVRAPTTGETKTVLFMFKDRKLVRIDL